MCFSSLCGTIIVQIERVVESRVSSKSQRCFKIQLLNILVRVLISAEILISISTSLSHIS